LPPPPPLLLLLLLPLLPATAAVTCCLFPLKVPFILDQLEQIQLRGGSHPFANRPLVILADKDKEELDAQVCGSDRVQGIITGFV
jgi:hypothetical protein